jgi:hypothetical protein
MEINTSLECTFLWTASQLCWICILHYSYWKTVGIGILVYEYLSNCFKYLRLSPGAPHVLIACLTCWRSCNSICRCGWLVWEIFHNYWEMAFRFWALQQTFSACVCAWFMQYLILHMTKGQPEHLVWWWEWVWYKVTWTVTCTKTCRQLSLVRSGCLCGGTVEDILLDGEV